MLGSPDPTVSLHVATIVVPVVVYFLILGLLNSRPHPQLLRGWQDLALLLIALSPLFVVPVLSYLRFSLLSMLLVPPIVATGIWVLVPRGHNWVVYNVSLHQVTRTVEQVLQGWGAEAAPRRGGFYLPREKATLDISSFPLLRNVSIHFYGQGDMSQLARRFERDLSDRIGEIRTETSATTVAMLLVATAMLVAPLALVAHEAVKIVRVLTDLLN